MSCFKSLAQGPPRSLRQGTSLKLNYLTSHVVFRNLHQGTLSSTIFALARSHLHSTPHSTSNIQLSYSILVIFKVCFSVNYIKMCYTGTNQ